MARIFISHSSIDKPFARKLSERLKHDGHVTWIDEAEIAIGQSIFLTNLPIPTKSGERNF